MQALEEFDKKVEIHEEGQSISLFLKFPSGSPGQGNHDTGELVGTVTDAWDRLMRHSVRLHFWLDKQLVLHSAVSMLHMGNQ
jgi:hypothetical protein